MLFASSNHKGDGQGNEKIARLLQDAGESVLFTWLPPLPPPPPRDSEAPDGRLASFISSLLSVHQDAQWMAGG